MIQKCTWKWKWTSTYNTVLKRWSIILCCRLWRTIPVFLNVFSKIRVLPSLGTTLSEAKWRSVFMLVLEGPPHRLRHNHSSFTIELDSSDTSNLNQGSRLPSSPSLLSTFIFAVKFVHEGRVGGPFKTLQHSLNHKAIASLFVQSSLLVASFLIDFSFLQNLFLLLPDH